jgi:hypothetical protein
MDEFAEFEDYLDALVNLEKSSATGSSAPSSSSSGTNDIKIKKSKSKSESVKDSDELNTDDSLQSFFDSLDL